MGNTENGAGLPAEVTFSGPLKMTKSTPLLALLLVFLADYVVPSHQDWLKLGEQACLSGLKQEYLCTMQTDVRNKQKEFTVDPLLQARYLGPEGRPQPWLPEAPSVFPDLEIVIEASTGGFMSGKQVASTGYVDFLWCSDSSCEEILDLAYIWNPELKTCDHGFAFASFNNTVSGFGLPHSLDARPGGSFISQAVGTFPAQGGAHVKKAIAKCNSSPNLQTSFNVLVGGVNVAPTRQAAQIIARNESALAGFVGEYLGYCTTFVFPLSAWYADKRMFSEMNACSESKHTLLLLGLAGGIGYLFDRSMYATRSTGEEPVVALWPSMAINCSSLGYRTCAELCEFRERICPANLNSSACYLLVNISSAVGTLTMWGVNITATTSIFKPTVGPLDGQGDEPNRWIQNPPPPMFSYLLVSSLEEATVGNMGKPAACSSPGPRDWPDCKHDIAGRPFYMNWTLCLENATFNGTLGTPWQFFRDFTRTLWLTNGSHGLWSYAGVHGVGGIPIEYTTDTLELLTRNVQQEVSLASTAALSNIDSTMKWPGALFVLVISVLASLGAAYQGKDLWESMSKRKYPFWINLIVIIIVVGCGSLVPVGFIAAGELTTYSNNKQINGISYTQVAVDVIGSSLLNTKGSQKVVALVAIRTSYETSIVAPGILYGVTCAVIGLLIFCFYLRWFLPSSCYQLGPPFLFSDVR